MSMIIIISSELVSVSVLLCIIGVVFMRQTSEAQQRMEQYSSATVGTVEQQELAVPFRQRVLRPLLSRSL